MQDIYVQFALATILGGFLGMQREVRKVTTSTNAYHHFGGFRTYSVIGLFGAIAAYLYQQTDEVGMFLLPMLLVGVLIVTSYISGLRLGNDRDLLSELVAIVVFAIGALCILVSYTIPIIIGISITALLALKGTIRRALNHVNEEIFMDAVKFAIVAFVILPLLPNQPIDPWGIFNPFTVWFFVVVVSAMSFVGYVIARVIGQGKGIILTGIIGGIASSTAATLHLSALSKKTKGATVSFVIGIVLATLVMFIRMLLLVVLISEELAGSVLKCFLLMFTVTAVLLWGLMFVKKRKGVDTSVEMKEEMEVKSAFRVLPAIKFGGIFLLIQAFEVVSSAYLGGSGVYIFSAISGLADADPPTYIIASQFLDGIYTQQMATVAVIIAVVANSFSKAIIALSVGRRDVALSVFTILLISGISGIIGALFLV